jgi:hypothetical protein
MKMWKKKRKRQRRQGRQHSKPPMRPHDDALEHARSWWCLPFLVQKENARQEARRGDDAVSAHVWP